jgi:signal transduction histidine kinase
MNSTSPPSHAPPAVPLRAVLLFAIVLVLLVSFGSAGVVIDRRLERMLIDRARDGLALAPRILADRQTATGDALMMHAKELAHAPGLAELLARGARERARDVAERARNGYADEAVLVAGDAQAWSGPRVPAAIIGETREGKMPVSVVADGGMLRQISVAPVDVNGRWVGAAGVAIDINAAEAERIAGLTHADVFVLSATGVLGSTDASPAESLRRAVMDVPADGAVHEIDPGGHPYLAAVSPLSADGRIVFLTDVNRVLSVLPQLRTIAAAVALAALVAALLLGAVLASAVSRPVRDLASAADRLAAGDFGAPLRVSRIAEVTKLAAAFGAMRRALQARLRDLEDRQQRLAALQSELIQRERLAATGRLVVQLAHEVRNPVASVRNCLELIRRRAGTDAQTVTYTELATGELLRMHAMAEQLLDLHRPHAGGARVCDARQVAGEVRALLSIGAPEEMQLVVAGAEHRVDAAIGSDTLKQVLLSVCHNAREAMNHAGIVTMAVHARGDEAVIEVCDTGPGIRDDALPHIFDPFFTTKGARNGVGLGLFVAEGIIRNHGGSITAGNRSDARGARFQIVLPALGSSNGVEANAAGRCHRTVTVT